MRQILYCVILPLGLCAWCGCGQTSPPFSLNLEGLSVPGEAPPFDEVQEQALVDTLTAMFGTPDNPYAWPGTKLDMTKLRLAAGPSGGNHKQGEDYRGGLFRIHCAHCHGVTGNGLGPTAPFLHPYPRDFRNGVFKFISTKLGQRPTMDDLKRVIREGANGTAMPSFKVLLAEEEIDALAEYVKYLSLRGEYEIRMRGDDGAGIANKVEGIESVDDLTAEVIAGLANNMVKNEPQILRRWHNAQSQWETYMKDVDGFNASVTNLAAMELERETLKKAIDKAQDETKKKEATERLAELDDKIASERNKLNKISLIVVPPDPNDERIAAAIKKLTAELAQKQGHDASEPNLAGNLLFRTGKPNCAECHGPTGLGDGDIPSTSLYDHWNKPKDSRPPIDGVQDDDLWSLPLRAGRPRNLRLGVYRGGRRPVDIYRRIYTGINGTAMPGFGANRKPHEVWAIVQYVLSLPYNKQGGERRLHDVYQEKAVTGKVAGALHAPSDGL